LYLTVVVLDPAPAVENDLEREKAIRGGEMGDVFPTDDKAAGRGAIADGTAAAGVEVVPVGIEGTVGEGGGGKIGVFKLGGAVGGAEGEETVRTDVGGGKLAAVQWKREGQGDGAADAIVGERDGGHAGGFDPAVSVVRDDVGRLDSDDLRAAAAAVGTGDG
jgi:hypothetical protein